MSYTISVRIYSYMKQQLLPQPLLLFHKIQYNSGRTINPFFTPGVLMKVVPRIGTYCMP